MTPKEPNKGKWENLTVSIKGVPITGITHVSYNGIPYYDCIVEVTTEQADLMKLDLEVILSNTGDSRFDCSHKIVHIDKCSIYLVKIH